ncbi:MAG: 2Fe-2S iron-sulfur cluster-binding protein [Ketobacteraceae bacterium]|nr:2Fe-2S iron-sulfur cluster-binding protein [Ketobacteraceae bacterium]
MALIKVTNLKGEKSELDAPNGDTLMEALRDNGYDEIEAICGGVCSCSTCHVYIEGGWMDKLGERSEDEYQLVSSTEHFRDNSRLSCQITVTDEMDGLEVTIAEQSY